MCRHRNGLSFLCSVSEVSKRSFNDRRTHKLFMLGYSKLSNTKICHSPKDHAPNWHVPVTVGMFGILCTESDSNSDDSHEDGNFQIPNPVTVCTFEIDCDGPKKATVTEILRGHSPPPHPLPDHTAGGGRKARCLTTNGDTWD